MAHRQLSHLPFFLLQAAIEEQYMQAESAVHFKQLQGGFLEAVYLQGRSVVSSRQQASRVMRVH